jgi:hypothetical protein
MTDYEYKKLLLEKKVADSFQFQSSCKYKLDSAKLSLDAIKLLVDTFADNEKEFVQDIKQRAFNNPGTPVGVTFKNDNVDYLGITVPRYFVVNKLVFELFGILHSYFDVFAQWINTALLAEDGVSPIKQVNIRSVIKELSSFPEYTGPTINLIKNCISSNEYNYISDANNVVKHRYEIHSKMSSSMFTGNTNVSVNAFRKDKITYGEVPLTNMAESCYIYCAELYVKFYDYLVDYYSSNNNTHVAHRYYNPITYMQFENLEDANKLNPQFAANYIEIAPEELAASYDLLLFNDSADSIEIRNSPYSIVMLKDPANSAYGSYYGYLTPVDSDEYKLDDGRLITYRRYLPTHADHFACLWKIYCPQINTNIKFHYYPHFSKGSIVILHPDH